MGGHCSRYVYTGERCCQFLTSKKTPTAEEPSLALLWSPVYETYTPLEQFISRLRSVLKLQRLGPTVDNISPSSSGNIELHVVCDQQTSVSPHTTQLWEMSGETASSSRHSIESGSGVVARRLARPLETAQRTITNDDGPMTVAYLATHSLLTTSKQLSGMEIVGPQRGEYGLQKF
ncbi:hypothetical protein BDU57DRAFT_528851 [Ampelomyces quisqualis]|uniref:Uncharacterized protein n=1 Tax=Ampelomyces quisqualis TaxID=50730 RepID=A0A6A5QV74_AMPQU|nr:hypothetical protein BDU57DRAFT_528851 [Ampelomyces quisqualis]